MILAICPNPSIDTMVTVSQFAPGTVHRALNEEHYPGGKGVHVAMAARELGSEVRLLAFWAGPTGRWIRGECEKIGISCAGTEAEGWSRTCITIRTEAQSQWLETELLGRGPTIDQENVISFQAEFERHIESADVVAMSGSWPIGSVETAYSDLIAKSQAKNKPAILDCTGPMLKCALRSRPYAIHLNRTEAQSVLEIDDPAAAAKKLADYCQISIVTAGKSGAYFCEAGNLLLAECGVESVYSSVGSGDCLVAGFAVATSRGLPLNNAAILACACGAANCLRRELGMLFSADVNSLVPRVTVRRLI